MGETAQLNLIQKIARIREIADVIQRNKSGYGYKYTSDDVILPMVKAGMKKYNVSLIPSIEPDTFILTPHSYTKKKWNKELKKMDEEIVNEFLVSAQVNMTWVNDDNPSEREVVPWYMVGEQSDASQCFGSALTYSNRYFMLKALQIATPDDDPDAYKRKKMEAEHEDEKPAVAAIIMQIDEIVKKNLTDETRKDFVAAMKKSIQKDGKPSADYMSIASLNVAQKAYATACKFFEIEEAAKEE